MRACLVASLVGLAACSSSVDVSEGSESEVTNAPAPTEAEQPAPDPITPPEPPKPETPASPSKPATVTAEAILAKVKDCATKLSSAPYARDAGGTANIDVCGLGSEVVYWKADLDVDCDGKESAVCNKSTDPSYQAQTATTDSTGAYLDAAKLPFIVVPGVSSRWSYKTSGIAMGSVGLVIYNGKVEYGIVGDVGPTSILGEASYAMAQSLGINPNPKTGGTANEVTYIVFTGSSAVVKKKEDHAEAVAIGKKKAEALVAQP